MISVELTGCLAGWVSVLRRGENFNIANMMKVKLCMMGTTH